MRATQDSNLRPSAPESGSKLVEVKDVARSGGDLGATLRRLAERQIRAVGSRSRFAHRYSVELAETAIEAADMLEVGDQRKKGSA